MSVLVLGGGGLLGSHLTALYKTSTIKTTKTTCNVLDLDRLEWYIERKDVTSVVNCAGITHHNPDYISDDATWMVNSAAPHNIRKLCDKHTKKLVQVSTDCVFPRESRTNTELFTARPEDRYGESKLAGEITSSPHLTIRTSFVGFPDPSGRGLLYWLYGQDEVDGYTNVLWNGMTAVALSHYLMYYAQSRDSGLLHLYGQTITKDELLRVVNRVFGWKKTIHPASSPRPVVRTLKSYRDGIRIPGTTNFGEAVSAMFILQEKLMRGM